MISSSKKFRQPRAALLLLHFLAFTLLGCTREDAVTREARILILARTISTNNDLEVRSTKSRELFFIMKDTRCNNLSPGTIELLGELFNIKDDSVRYWIARGMRRIGPCAKLVLPDVLPILPIVDCMPGLQRSAEEIHGLLSDLGSPRRYTNPRDCAAR